MSKSKGILYGAMIVLGIVSMGYGLGFATRMPSALGFCLLGGINLIAGCIFLNHWHKVNYRQNGPYWVLEVLDDLGTWGYVSWSDIHAKASVHCKMLVHHRPSSDNAFDLEDLTAKVKTLSDKRVFDYIYHGYNMRMRNVLTAEVIPLEALGLEEKPITNIGGHTKIVWSQP